MPGFFWGPYSRDYIGASSIWGLGFSTRRGSWFAKYSSQSSSLPFRLHTPASLLIVPKDVNSMVAKSVPLKDPSTKDVALRLRD